MSGDPSVSTGFPSVGEASQSGPGEAPPVVSDEGQKFSTRQAMLDHEQGATLAYRKTIAPSASGGLSAPSNVDDLQGVASRAVPFDPREGGPAVQSATERAIQKKTTEHLHHMLGRHGKRR